MAFHFVSSITREGIQELETQIIDLTLKQKHIGEAIPVSLNWRKYLKIMKLNSNPSEFSKKVWLSLEKKVKEKSETCSLIDYTEIVEIAHSIGIIEPKEVHEVVTFLSDLGSLQYFEDENLKEKVIINPQVNLENIILGKTSFVLKWS